MTRPCEDDASVSPPTSPVSKPRWQSQGIVQQQQHKHEEIIVCSGEENGEGIPDEKQIPVPVPMRLSKPNASYGDKKPSINRPIKRRRRRINPADYQTSLAAATRRSRFGAPEYSRRDSVDDALFLVMYTLDFQGDHFLERDETDEGDEVANTLDPTTQHDEDSPNPTPTDDANTQPLKEGISLQHQQHTIIQNDNTFLPAYDELATLCASAGCLEPNIEYCTNEEYINHDMTWNAVREWIRSHGGLPSKTLPYLKHYNGFRQTALHLACLNQPPHDVIDRLISILRETNTLEILYSRDRDGRTPLHLICANSGPTCQESLTELIRYCESTLHERDNFGLTPLHNALIGPFRENPRLIHELAKTGACKVPASGKHVGGLLPVHYACVFQAPVATLNVLIDDCKCSDNNVEFDGGLTEFDGKGRTALHWAILSFKDDPAAALSNIHFLLQKHPKIVNKCSGSTHEPIVFLLEFVNRKRHNFVVNSINPDRQEKVLECYGLLLKTKSKLSSGEVLKFDDAILREIRNAPPWLFPKLISCFQVEDMLDRKMKARFPTTILILDALMQIMIMIAFSLAVDKSLMKLTENQNSSITPAEAKVGFNMRSLDVLFLYIGATYFLLRELMQGVSLILSQSEFLEGWRFYLSDCLSICYVVVVYAWAIVLDKGTIADNETLSTSAALSIAILWMKFFAFLRMISFDFSVFVSGVYYVAKRLVPYIICLLCFLIAFSQIFFTIFYQEPSYGCPPISESNNETTMDSDTIEGLQCFEATDTLPFCTLGDSFLKVCTMFLGEVDDRDFRTSTLGTVVFALFMFFMIIFFANVLIAIVTGYYKSVQDEQGIAVFYTNRLYFLAEVYTFVLCIKKHCLCNGHVTTARTQSDSGRTERRCWRRLATVAMMRQKHNINNSYVGRGMSNRDFNYKNEKDTHWWNERNLNKERYPRRFSSQRKIGRNVLRFINAALAIVMMSIWFVIGILTLGLAWPPQVKEWIFLNKTRFQSLEERKSNLLENQVQDLQEEMKGLNDLINERHQTLIDREDRQQEFKKSIEEMKIKIETKRKEISSLFVEVQKIKIVKRQNSW